MLPLLCRGCRPSGPLENAIAPCITMDLMYCFIALLFNFQWKYQTSVFIVSRRYSFGSINRKYGKYLTQPFDFLMDNMLSLSTQIDGSLRLHLLSSQCLIGICQALSQFAKTEFKGGPSEQPLTLPN